MRSLFWILTSVLAAVVVHLSYVLFVPSNQFNGSVEAALKNQKVNTLAVLDGSLQLQLMPFVSENDLVAMCKYDVAEGPVTLSMQVPSGYWTFSVYTIRGRQVYALNDRQADTRSFSVKLQKAPNLLEQLLSSRDEDEVGAEALGWHVSLRENEGLAFLWMPQSDPWRRLEAKSVLRKSSCARVK
jgi:uncharacterized membrane protein